MDQPGAVRRVFLRTIVRQPRLTSFYDENLEADKETLSLCCKSVIIALQRALDELELAAHDSSARADHVHMFLSILRAQTLESLRGSTRQGFPVSYIMARSS